MTESIYSKMGVSATKEDVHEALKKTKIKELYPGSFCKILPDINGDEEYGIIQHQDGTGSKILQAYIHYKETNDPNWFRGSIYDVISMNLDDMLCVGATSPIILTDTIDRNPERIPGEVISVIIEEFNNACNKLQSLGVPIHFAGGETADLGDQVATITLNGATTTRFKLKDVISGQEIQPGDIIVGIRSTGKATYEDKANSGIGSNGLTMARHTLMDSSYREKYPETIEPSKLKKEVAYFGKYKFDDYSEELGMTVGEAILSPTRTHAPIIYELLEAQRDKITGIVHNTGGGQTKCLHIGKNIHYVKDNLFEVAPIFKLIQEQSNETWKNMYQTFNCGSRLEIICKPEALNDIIRITNKYNLEAKQVGKCEASETGNKLTITSQYGNFAYQH